MGIAGWRAFLCTPAVSGMTDVFVSADDSEKGVSEHGRGDPARLRSEAAQLALIQSGQALSGLKSLFHPPSRPRTGAWGRHRNLVARDPAHAVPGVEESVDQALVGRLLQGLAGLFLGRGRFADRLGEHADTSGVELDRVAIRQVRRVTTARGPRHPDGLDTGRHGGVCRDRHLCSTCHVDPEPLDER